MGKHRIGAARISSPELVGGVFTYTLPADFAAIIFNLGAAKVQLTTDKTAFSLIGGVLQASPVCDDVEIAVIVDTVVNIRPSTEGLDLAVLLLPRQLVCAEKSDVHATLVTEATHERGSVISWVPTRGVLDPTVGVALQCVSHCTQRHLHEEAGEMMLPLKWGVDAGVVLSGNAHRTIGFAENPGPSLIEPGTPHQSFSGSERDAYWLSVKSPYDPNDFHLCEM